MGTISCCARVSSPQERLYDGYIYGEVDNKKLVFDNERFKNIMSQNNIYTQSMCTNCFAKWNCGGGCRLFHDSFSPKFEEVRCEFVRKGLKQQMLDVLASNFRKSSNTDLNEFISKKIANGEV